MGAVNNHHLSLSFMLPLISDRQTCLQAIRSRVELEVNYLLMHICISLTHNQSKSEDQSWNNKEIMAEEGGVQGTVDGDMVLEKEKSLKVEL